MKTNQWLNKFKDMIDREEAQHLEVDKAIIKMQFRNATTGVIELHQWEYTSKDAVKLEARV
jgi:hypothetical protein